MSKYFPETNPSKLLKYRDSIYASDLLICAVAYFDFFSFFKNSPRTFEEICNSFQIAPRPADVMLSLFLAMGLIEKHNLGYSLTSVARDYLVSNTPWSLVPYYASQSNRPQCREFYQVLKTGKPAGWSSKEDGKDWLEAMRDPQFANAFTSAMDSRGAFLARELANKLDCSAYDSLLDIAGGSGIYACALAEVYNNISATVLEIPPVDDTTRRAIASKNMSHRVSVVAGDMFQEIPVGYDIHLFANTFHDWDYGSVQKLAEMSYNTINNGGMIAVFDAHLNEAKNGPLAVAEYSCLLMHSTEGRCYSAQEIKEILSRAGFINIQVEDVAADRSVVTAPKKA